MTIILTYINKYGIIHASDSNLTAGSRTATEAKKTFEIPHLNAGLTVAGAYSVEGLPMDLWMSDFIRKQSDTAGSQTLSGFAHNLRRELDARMSLPEKNKGSIIHIAGYVERDGISHPEFWYVSNVGGLDLSTGEYTDIPSPFQVSEHFWTRDSAKHGLMEAFQKGGHVLYINGFASGRISFRLLEQAMQQFFEAVWSNPNWAFRPPCSLEETTELVALNLRIISTLFRLSDYPAPFIGGQPQTYVIPQPPNAATQSLQHELGLRTAEDT